MVDEEYCGMLMFADDMSMVAEKEEEMDRLRMLDRVYEYSKKWRFRFKWKKEQGYGDSREAKKGETKMVVGRQRGGRS